MKKLFSIIMSVLMIACFMPTMAFAETGNEALVSAIEKFIDEAGKNGESNHTFSLAAGTEWPSGTPVYWKAENKDDQGDQNDAQSSGFAATLSEALKEAYQANKNDITIVCEPDADVGEMTHGHVADNLTIYGNNAYISDGECDLEVDTVKFNRTSEEKNETNGVCLDKNITITAYEMDNLGVWGERKTSYTINIKLIDCDGRLNGGENCQRVFLSEIGSKSDNKQAVNNITLKDCDFTTTVCPVKSDADGTINIGNCTFTDVAAPVNLKHDGSGEAKYTIKDCTFKNCGSVSCTYNKTQKKYEGYKDYAAPIRFVNGSGSNDNPVNATVENCKFEETIGNNGDILIGDGRYNKDNDYEIKLTVKNAGTDTTVMAQKKQYYNCEMNVADNAKAVTIRVNKGASLTTSFKKAFAAAEADSTYYDTLAEAITEADSGKTITLLNDVSESINIPASKTVTIDIAGHTLGESDNTVTSSGKLIIKDSAGTGKIAFDPSSYLESGYYASKTTSEAGDYWTIKKSSSSSHSGGSSSSSTTTTTDTVTNKTEDKTTDTSTSTGTTTVATTTATVKTETKTATDGTKTVAATVDNTTATKIVEKAVENKSEEVVIDTATATTGTTAVTETAAGTTTKVDLPEQTVKAIAEKTEAAVTIKSDAAEIKLDTEAVKAVAEQAGDTGTVNLVVETVAQNETKVEVDLKLVTSKGNVSDFKGGNVTVTVKLNTKLAAKPVVCVYIDDNGTYHKVKGVKNADGTFTFETGHFSTYAVMEEEEADKVIAEQTANVDKLVSALTLKARSAKTKAGNIKVTLTADDEAIKAIEDLGYTVKYKFYRSTKKAKGYKATVEKAGKTYTNTTGKKGTKYYYKARVMVYDAQGEVIAKSALSQCKYASRTR